MNVKNIISFTGGVFASVFSGIDTATQILGFIAALVSLALIVWDVIARMKNENDVKAKAYEDGVITPDEAEAIAKAENDTAKAKEALKEAENNIKRDI